MPELTLFAQPAADPGLVDGILGQEYLIVRAVYDNLPILQNLANNGSSLVDIVNAAMVDATATGAAQASASAASAGAAAGSASAAASSASGALTSAGNAAASASAAATTKTATDASASAAATSAANAHTSELNAAGSASAATTQAAAALASATVATNYAVVALGAGVIIGPTTNLVNITVPAPVQMFGTTGFWVDGDGGHGQFRRLGATVAQDALHPMDKSGAQFEYVPHAGRIITKAAGALGDGSALTAAAKFASLAACQVVYPFATSLAQTLDYLAAECASLFAFNKGGGNVHWTVGHYTTGNRGDQHPIRSRVTYSGDGVGSWLDYYGNAFLSYGMHPQDMPNIVWVPIGDIAAGAQQLVCTTHSDASKFTPGKCYFAASTGYDGVANNSVYWFQEVVKVTSVNPTTGVVTLEDPIEIAVVGAQLGDMPPAYAGQEIPHEAQFFNLRISTNRGGTGGTAFALNGDYKCFYHHLWIDGGTRLFSHNGPTKSRFSDIVATVSAAPATYNYGYVVEVQQGGYKTSYERIKVGVVNTTGDVSSTYAGLMLVAGARSRDISMENIEVDAPGIALRAFIATNGGIGHTFKNIKAMVKNVQLGANLVANANPQPELTRTAYRVRDVTISVVDTWAVGVIFGDNSTANPRGDEVHSLKLFGTQAVTGGQVIGSVIWSSASDCQVRDSYITGQYSCASAVTNSRIYNSVTGGPDSATTRSNIVAVSCQIVGAMAPPVPISTAATITSTTANNVVTTLAFPANFPWANKDRVKFRAEGILIGTAGAKTIVFANDAGAMETFTIAAATTGTIIVEGEVSVSAGAGTIDYRSGAHLIQNGIAPVTAGTNRTGVVTTAIHNFILQCWMASAGDSILFWKIDMQYTRTETGLEGGSAAEAA